MNPPWYVPVDQRWGLPPVELEDSLAYDEATGETDRRIREHDRACREYERHQRERNTR